MPSARRSSGRMPVRQATLLDDVPEETEVVTLATPSATPPESLAESETPTAAASSPSKTTPSSSPPPYAVDVSPEHACPPGTFEDDRTAPRALTWDELWASWPRLTAEQAYAVRACCTPLEVITPAAYPSILGNVLNFDVPPAVYPPTRTTYSLLSAWTTAKLHIDRGMRLGIVRRALSLSSYAPRDASFERTWAMLWGALQTWHPSLERRTLAIATATHRADTATLENDHVAALVAHASVYLYTLPWHFDALAHDHPYRPLVLVGENALVSMARSAALAMRYLPRHHRDHALVAGIGYDAAKAALWRADLHGVVAIRAACDAAVILYDMLDGKNDPGAKPMLDAWAAQSRKLRNIDRDTMFRDVDDSLRSDFFRCNPRNEHYW